MGPILTRAQCFQEGADARSAGVCRADNPYVLRSTEHTEWNAGWLATYDLDEYNDPASDREQPGDDPEGPPGGTLNER